MRLSNSQYDALMREYDLRRQDNADLLSRRQDEVYEAVPELYRIDEEISSAAMETFRARVSGQDEGTLHDRVEALREKKQQLMTDAGFPEDYLMPVYDCPDCRDTGYIDGEKCHCLLQAEMDILYGASHLGDILREESFSRFVLDYYPRDKVDSSGATARDSAEDALKRAREFASGDTEGANMLIYGDPGSGKTFLSHCIAGEFLSRTRPVVYVTAYTLTDIFAKRAFEKTPESRREYDDLYSCDLLIIDDLGTEFSNSFTQPSFFQCINERILRKRSTVISTNLSLGQIKETYTERVFSRLVEHYDIVHLFGEDIRVRKKITKHS
ncbi:MAG: ATP-binding protein [Lachnospiraceae bacterium]|nr:ATP-binding protein [Lachnospiraceae bacterium]